MNFLRQGLP